MRGGSVAISNSSKQDIIRRLLVTKQKAHILEMSLRFEGRGDEADQLSEKTETLSENIDQLLDQVMDDWMGKSDEIISDITKANTSIQSSIRAIENGLNVAENVVKVLSYVDDVIVIASKIAAAVG